MINYYTILEINENCTKEEIRKKYKELSKIYHPDKNNGDDTHFILIKEAYDNLYNNELRQKHNLQIIFGEVHFTDEEYNLLKKYYEGIIHSQEFRLMKLIYNSIPKNVKDTIWSKVKGYQNKKIVKANKSIDITKLFEDEIINLCIQRKDYENNTLKIIYILSNNGIYYLYLRRPNGMIIIDNYNCVLILKFFIIN